MEPSEGPHIWDHWPKLLVPPPGFGWWPVGWVFLMGCLWLSSNRHDPPREYEFLALLFAINGLMLLWWAGVSWVDWFVRRLHRH